MKSFVNNLLINVLDNIFQDQGDPELDPLYRILTKNQVEENDVTIAQKVKKTIWIRILFERSALTYFHVGIRSGDAMVAAGKDQ